MEIFVIPGRAAAGREGKGIQSEKKMHNLHGMDSLPSPCYARLAGNDKFALGSAR
jgi:hypothetical protein